MKSNMKFFSLILLLSGSNRIFSMEEEVSNDQARALYYNTIKEADEQKEETTVNTEENENRKIKERLDKIYLRAIKSKDIEKINTAIKKLNKDKENYSWEIQADIDESVNNLTDRLEKIKKKRIEKQLAQNDKKITQMLINATKYNNDVKEQEEKAQNIQEIKDSKQEEVIENQEPQEEIKTNTEECLKKEDTLEEDLTKTVVLEKNIFETIKKAAKTKEEENQVDEAAQKEKAKLKNLFEKYVEKEKAKHELITQDQDKIKKLEEELEKAKKDFKDHQESLKNIDKNIKKMAKEGREIKDLNIEEFIKIADTKDDKKVNTCTLV